MTEKLFNNDGEVHFDPAFSRLRKPKKKKQNPFTKEAIKIIEHSIVVKNINGNFKSQITEDGK